ncbi:hypothetical protein SCUCBS95973_009957, partial [Sporothrix curviconia]
MKSSLVYVVAALVAAASAAPSSSVPRDIEAVVTVDTLDSPQLCIHIRDCVDALSPSVKACAKAARDKGKNLREDAACLREALDASVSV